MKFVPRNKWSDFDVLERSSADILCMKQRKTTAERKCSIIFEFRCIKFRALLQQVK